MKKNYLINNHNNNNDSTIIYNSNSKNSNVADDLEMKMEKLQLTVNNVATVITTTIAATVATLKGPTLASTNSIAVTATTTPTTATTTMATTNHLNNSRGTNIPQQLQQQQHPQQQLQQQQISLDQIEGVRYGKCKWFNVAKGWGFITPLDGGQEVFVHQSVIQMPGFRSLGEREEVEFECKITDRGLEATRVTGKQGVDCYGSTFRPRTKRRFRRVRCYNCGEFANHIATKCNLGPQPKSCHLCKQMDHLFAQCPTNNNNNSNNKNNNNHKTRKQKIPKVLGTIDVDVTSVNK